MSFSHWREFFVDVWRFFRRPDSDRASILIIQAASHLNEKDLRNMREYLECLEQHYEELH